MTKSRRQLHLFDTDIAVASIRTHVNMARLHKQRVATRRSKWTKGLEIAVENLTQVIDALLDGNQAQLDKLGVDQNAVQALGRRLTNANRKGRP